MIYNILNCFHLPMLTHYKLMVALSRLIKRPDQPYNDGYRHMIKYSRYNQTIQIVVDYQTYLPTMSVITANHVNKYSKTSLIMIGTAVSDQGTFDENQSDSYYTNYSGCISSEYPAICLAINSYVNRIT